MPRGKVAFSQKEILKKFREIHGMRYLYSKVEYINMHERVEIICRKKGHGSFWQMPYAHINNKNGCPKCINKGTNSNYGECSIKEIIIKSNKKHKNKYDYSLCTKRNKYMTIICPIHGIFKQATRNHLSGNGCPKCANKGKGENGKLTPNEILKRFRKIHGRTYDYSKTIPVNSATKVTVTCRKHGDFKISPYRHYALKRGCPKCTVEINGKNKRITQDEFLNRAYKIHSDIYNYSKSKYRDMHSKIDIICSIHGIFKMTPFRHINDGCGCPKCSVSSKTKKIVARFLDQNNINYTREYNFPNLVNIGRLRFDFAIFRKEKLVCLIECHGQQHYMPVKHFGGEEHFKNRKRLDKKKENYCIKNNISLYIIPYWENAIYNVTKILKRRKLI